MRFLTIPEAAAKLNISRQRLYVLIDEGRIQAGEIIGRRVVTSEAVTVLSRELRASRVKYGRGGVPSLRTNRNGKKRS